MQTEINVNCAEVPRYYSAVIELDGTTELDESVCCDEVDPLNAIALALMEHLIKTGQVVLSVNNKKIEPKEEEETPYESFFDGSDWLYTHEVIK